MVEYLQEGSPPRKIHNAIGETIYAKHDCIEGFDNELHAAKAINADRMALRGDGTHFVSLDKVVKTMREIGADMELKYKERSRGGLAVKAIEC